MFPNKAHCEQLLFKFSTSESVFKANKQNYDQVFSSYLFQNDPCEELLVFLFFYFIGIIILELYIKQSFTIEILSRILC